jgi:hypothetical protein
VSLMFVSLLSSSMLMMCTFTHNPATSSGIAILAWVVSHGPGVPLQGFVFPVNINGDVTLSSAVRATSMAGSNSMPTPRQTAGGQWSYRLACGWPFSVRGSDTAPLRRQPGNFASLPHDWHKPLQVTVLPQEERDELLSMASLWMPGTFFPVDTPIFAFLGFKLLEASRTFLPRYICSSRFRSTRQFGYGPDWTILRKLLPHQQLSRFLLLTGTCQVHRFLKAFAWRSWLQRPALRHLHLPGLIFNSALRQVSCIVTAPCTTPKYSSRVLEKSKSRSCDSRKLLSLRSTDCEGPKTPTYYRHFSGGSTRNPCRCRRPNSGL